MPNPEVKKIGKYEIQAELGQGGFGRVYRAFDPTVGRPVALKILMTEGNRDLLTRFRNEATSAGNLRHRNIVTIYDFGEFSGRPYLVMELLEGEDLTQTISSGKPLTLLQKMNIMDQVADGLDCAHSNGVVHRDVKPANIRLLPDGTVKILDFGIARVSRDQKATRLTQQGDLIGTILYVSPEQFGGADADALCDIFAYGVTYYEFLAGKHPFGSSDPRSVMFKITMEDPPPLRSLVPDCPEALEQILNRALQKDRELRYQSLRDLRLDTEPLIIELKQERARELVAEAQELSGHETPQQAISLINDALNLDPGNREARQLREIVQRTLQKKALQPRVDSMLETAREQLAKRAVSQAVQTLESAYRLDQTDVRIRDLLESAREQLRTVKEAARTAAAAQAHLSRGEWTAALEKGSEAIRLDSANREAARVVEAVQKYELDLNSRIESQMGSGDLEGAISALRDLAALHPESTEIQQRIAAAAANKVERERVRAALEQARRLVAGAKFGEAVELLSGPGLPDDAGLAALRKQAEEGLAARRRADALAKAVQDAGALLRGSRIDEALQEIENSLSLYPGEAKLLELRGVGLKAKAIRERNVEIQRVSSECDRLSAENRFGEALETVKGALLKLPSDPVLLVLRERLQEQKKGQDRAAAIHTAAEEGRRLLEHRPQEAVEFLEIAAVEYPEDGGLKQLLGRAQEELRSQQRREAVNKAADEARQRIGRNDFDGALEVVDRVLKAYRDEALLLDLRQKAVDARAEAKARVERQRAVEEAAGKCERLIEAANFAEALETAEAALRQFPEEPLLLEKQRRAQEEQERRTKDVRRMLARAAAFEKELEYSSALAEVDAGLARYPGEKSLAERRGALEAAHAELVRKRAHEAAVQHAREFVDRCYANLPDAEISAMLEEAMQLARKHSADPELQRALVDAGQHLTDLRQARAKAAAGDLDGARAVSDAYLKRFPQHAGFLALQGHIADQERQTAIDYRREVEKALGGGADVDRRVQLLDEAVRRYPQEPYYQKELDILNAARAAAGEANSLEKSGRFGEAADRWKSLASTYPAYPGLQAHIARATESYERARRDARARWSEQIQKALDEGSHAQALALTAKAEVDFPGEFHQIAMQAQEGADRRSKAQGLLSDAKDLVGKSQWEAGQGKLREAMESAPGDQAIAKPALEAHSKYARAAIGAGNWKAAEALLQQASTLSPGFKAPGDLVSGIEERKRAEFVEQSLGQIRQLQQAGELQAALDAVQKALSVYPEEPKLRELRSSLENALGEAARREERKRALEQLRGVETEARKAAGIEELERILARAQLIAKTYAKDGEFAGCVESILNQVEPLRRGRQLLEGRKPYESEKIADEMLARFEAHPAYLALKKAVQDARAQAAAAYLDELIRRLRAERNLERREAILMEALDRYPDEPYFKRELDAVREKQRLIAGVLKDAQAAEQAGRYEDAAGQWEKLRTLDAGYPGIEAAIERLRGLLASARAAALEAGLAEVRGAMEQGSLPQADSLLKRVESEFGASASEEGARLRTRLDGLIAATRLAEEGRGLFARKDWAGGAGKFLQAARSVPQERHIVEGFFGELIRHAEALVKSDWRGAESILQAAGELQPGSEALPALRARVEERRREEIVAGVLEESQKLCYAGQLRAAEKSVQAALASYPGESRLTAQLAGIRSAMEEEAQRQRREQAIAELTALAQEAETANLKRLRKSVKQIDTVVARAGSDKEVQEKAAEVRKVFADRIAELEAPRQPAAPALPQAIEFPHSVEAPRSSDAPRAAGLVEEPEPAIWWKRKAVAIAAGAVVLIGGAIAVTRVMNSDSRIPVNVTSEVAGAAVTVGNQSCVTPACGLKLPAGSYVLIAKKDGFKTITQPVTVAARQAELRLPLAFEPLPEILRVNTNFDAGRVLVDGRPAGNLRDGQFSTTAELAPGTHTLRVTGGGGDFQTTWKSATGASPELVGPMEAKDVQAAVIANAGGTAAIACNCGVQNVTVDGAPAGQTAAADGASSPLQRMTEGSRKLAFAGHSVILDVRPNPTLSVFLALDRNVGTIVVETAEDNARIYLNNKVYRRTTQGGAVRIPVEVGDYSVRVEKDGYQGSPAQTVAVKKGDEARVVAALKPIPPVMEIVAALAGAQVKIDGRAMGEIASNGSFRTEVTPGERVIELTKDEYTPARVTMDFPVGKTVRLNQGQVAMARIVKPPTGPDPKQVDAQDWDRARNSNTIDSLEDYVRRHPDGAHVDEARSTVTRLRQEAQANAARQAEQGAWDAVDRKSKAALRDFLTRYGNGAHAQEARGLIAGIDRDAEAAAASLRAKEQKDKEQKEKDQEQAKALADEQAIKRTVSDYEAAYNRMDLKALESIWNAMPRDIADKMGAQFRDARSMTFHMQAVGRPVVSGDSATVECTRTTSFTAKNGMRVGPVNERVRTTLIRAGSGWVIRSITPL